MLGEGKPFSSSVFPMPLDQFQYDLALGGFMLSLLPHA